MTTEWTEEQINDIVNECSSGDYQVDIFSRDFYINISLDSKVDGKWVSSRFDYVHHIFELRDFEDCEDEDAVREVFRDIIKEQVRENLVCL